MLLRLAAKRAKVVSDLLTASLSSQMNRVHISPLTDIDQSESPPAPIVNIALHAVTQKQQNSSQSK
jgi:hypothetical protein